MGGSGRGHKSVAARQSRLVNMQKARAARKRAPLPWRSGLESRIIEQLVWQWFLGARGWRQEAGESRDKSEMQIPRRYAPRNDNVKSNGEWSVKSARNGNVYGGAGKPWAKLRVARFLGVSHTWVNKLVKKFEVDPERMRRKMAAFAPASIEKLERAREETRWEREHGRLRGPIRYRRVKVVIQGKKRKVAVATREERKRRALRQAQDQPYGLSGVSGPAFAGATARQASGEKNKQQIPHTATRRPVRNDNIPLPYREVPEWAKGLLLPGDPGTLRSGPFVPQGKRTPRPVPFAFRRRR